PRYPGFESEARGGTSARKDSSGGHRDLARRASERGSSPPQRRRLPALDSARAARTRAASRHRERADRAGAKSHPLRERLKTTVKFPSGFRAKPSTDGYQTILLRLSVRRPKVCAGRGGSETRARPQEPQLGLLRTISPTAATRRSRPTARIARVSAVGWAQIGASVCKALRCPASIGPSFFSISS